MRLKNLCFFIILLLSQLSFAEENKNFGNIYARADLWCPYNCKPGDENPGYLVEILQKAFGKENIKYETMNWARAITETRSGTYDLIIAAAKEDAPDFPLSIQIGKSRNCFFTLEKKNIKFVDLKSLEKIKLGIAKDYSYYKELDEYIAKNKENENKINESFGDIVLEKFINKLTHQEIDAFVEDPVVVKYFLKQNQDITVQLKTIGCGNSTDLYFGFAPNKKESTERILQINKTVKEMIKSGEMERIIKKYGILKWF
nr:ABC transporter substrate-binding protein [Pigmentibacter ruber]